MSVDPSWLRHTAATCAIACGAMIAGPGVTGTAVASADLFGIDVDVLHIFGDKDKKKKSNHHRAGVGGRKSGGAKTSAGGAGSGPKTSVGAKNSGPKSSVGATNTGPRASGRDTDEGPTTSIGAGESGADRSSGPARRATRSVDAPESVTVGGAGVEPPAAAPGGGGGGGGGVSTNRSIGRAPNLAPVPTAPSARSIVIRAEPPQAPVGGGGSPAVPAAPAPVAVAPPPVVVPPVPAPLAPLPSGPPAGAPSAPSTDAPKAQPPAADPRAVRSIPDSFRIGYADYLRVASTQDLLFAVLPGVAGMVLLTAAGGVAGFRQARAAQTLPSPQIARFLP